jgi:pimeloyl-ACP methyl ester carboxylesterase
MAGAAGSTFGIAADRPAKRKPSRLIAGLLGMLGLGVTASASAAPATAGYVNAPNQYVSVDGVRLAYRSVGSNSSAPPVVLFQHFTGTMDDWDSAMVDGLAQRRRVIILGNPGIGASGGPTPDSVAGMAHLAEGFIDALKLKSVDLLGFSIGGSVAQLLVSDRPELVRKIILVGAGPQGGEGIKDLMSVIGDGMKRAGDRKVDPKVALFFTDTEAGKAAGDAYAKRIANHKVDAEPQASQEAIGAQAKALITWGMSPANFAELEKIKQPVLIVNGSHDLIIPTVNSYVLYQHIPNAQLILYPDSGHGSLFQYHDLFVSQVNTFLDGVN